MFLNKTQLGNEKAIYLTAFTNVSLKILSQSLINAHLNNFGFISGHGTCDAENCLCPDGRTFDEDWTIWEIVRKSRVYHSIHAIYLTEMFSFSDSLQVLRSSRYPRKMWKSTSH